jgi:hypothetical protein
MIMFLVNFNIGHLVHFWVPSNKDKYQIFSLMYIFLIAITKQDLLKQT